VYVQRLHGVQVHGGFRKAEPAPALLGARQVKRYHRTRWFGRAALRILRRTITVECTQRAFQRGRRRFDYLLRVEEKSNKIKYL
jgi:hypothetical protein